jgi:hypothetical protein
MEGMQGGRDCFEFMLFNETSLNKAVSNRQKSNAQKTKKGCVTN